jgi:hypothetical protein
VGQLLGGLGEDAAEVAKRLDEAGVRGTPRDVRDCAIAVYLSAVLGADPDVRGLDVMADGIVISPTRRWAPSISVGLSAPVRTFVAGFDRNDYPALVRAERRRDAAPRTQPQPGNQSA